MPGAISPGVTRAVVPAHAAKKLAAEERERDRVGVLRTTLLEIKTKKKSTERRFREREEMKKTDLTMGHGYQREKLDNGGILMFGND
jgi:hypothetical protein